MGRIRTIKPDFFKHEALFEAEKQTGLPLRLAYAGLWTQCDREGRFLWRPRALKTDILPYDEIDFARVLDALLTRGFLVKYGSENREIGAIPSWHRHQVINNRETASALPPPPENIGEFDAWGTRGPRVGHSASGEGKGREGNIETPNGVSHPATPVTGASPKKSGSKKRQSYPETFDAVWKAYPTSPNMSKAEACAAWSKLDAEDQAKVAAAIPGFIAYCKATPDYHPVYFDRFIRQRRFDGYADATVPAVTEADWRRRLIYARNQNVWSTAAWGPMPGAAGCMVPGNLLLASDGSGWADQASRGAA